MTGISISDKDRWNARYAERGVAASNQLPSTWLTAHESLLRDLHGGYALDIACGNGRNAVYLATLGFQVDAFDISEVAIDWVKEQTAQHQLSIKPEVVDLETASLRPDRYNVIINFKFLLRSLFPQIKAALRTGGLLFFETMCGCDANAGSQPMNPAYVLDHNELLHAFLDLRILAYQESKAACEPGHQAHEMASLIARKA